MKKPYRQGVHAIILDEDDNVLIIQKNIYKTDEWTVIGGGREDRESLEQNLYREIKEETGLTEGDFLMLGISSKKQKYDYPEDMAKKVHDGKFRGQLYDQVLLRLKSDEYKERMRFDPIEIRRHKWVKHSELKKYLIFPGQYLSIKGALKEKGFPLD